MSAPELSIIIVSYNAGTDLEGCLRSIVDAPPRASHEIVVVDNHSADGSARRARSFSGVRVIDAGANLGFAAASNIGIRASSGVYLLLLNSDTVVPPGAIDRLFGEMRSSGAAVAGPRLIDADGRPELSFGRMIAPLAEYRQKRLVRGVAARDPRTLARVEAMTHRQQWPDWVSGACLLVSRADAEGVGLLDERYFLYTEDVDFCAAIRRHGGRVLFTPAAEIVHLRGRSAASAPAETNEAYRRSHLAFYEKHHPWMAPLLRIYLRMRRRERLDEPQEGRKSQDK